MVASGDLTKSQGNSYKRLIEASTTIEEVNGYVDAAKALVEFNTLTATKEAAKAELDIITLKLIQISRLEMACY
ncbi:hypothetical protein [Vagococcus jeotgali]|uniref:hypothetical protein n=1 Tax=Vagococcus jeotgali TaxID=3109030 RepID=UPI002DD8E550|nr:hypothetical protein [Vagococcus sp. B2T-5]